MPRIDQGRIEWLQPLEKPMLEHGDLHLWRIDLELMGQSESLGQLLSLDERDRYHRLLTSAKRAAFLAGRSALRLILAKYLHLLPKAIRFGYNATGKPYLVNPKCVLDIRFNLSHSGKWMVMGVGKGADLGVDIEEVRPVQKTWALEKLFSCEEREFLAGLPEDEKDVAFIAAWTEKEAAAKVNGSGLSGKLANQGSRENIFENHPNNCYVMSRKNTYWFIHFEPAPGYLGCAALQSDENPRVQFYEFSECKKPGIFPDEVQPLVNGKG